MIKIKDSAERKKQFLRILLKIESNIRNKLLKAGFGNILAASEALARETRIERNVEFIAKQRLDGG